MLELSRRAPPTGITPLTAPSGIRPLSATTQGSNSSFISPGVMSKYGSQRSKARGDRADLLVQYLHRLIHVSGRFVQDMEYDPDPYGVAVSFAQNYRELKDAFSDWASVVADFILVFAPVEMKKVRLSHSISMPGRRRMGGMAAITSSNSTGSAQVPASRLELSDIVRVAAGRQKMGKC